MKIYLNPGHDRKLDSGAVNESMDLQECDLAYDLGCLVKERLEANGIAVILGQSDDLYAICDEANEAEVDLFVSIHFNAFNKRATGTETLISGTGGSLMLGHCIQSNIKAVLCLPDRGLKERPGLFVLRNTAMPAALVEVCFMDNDYDLRRYMGRAEETAAAIATGIIQYPGMMGRVAA
jgi:N-acetylmuramoyl-L-alanine amidase